MMARRTSGGGGGGASQLPAGDIRGLTCTGRRGLSSLGDGPDGKADVRRGAVVPAIGRGSLDRTVRHPPGASGAQRGGVINAVVPRKSGGHQGHKLVGRVGPAWSPEQVQMPVNQLGQTQAQARVEGNSSPALDTRR